MQTYTFVFVTAGESKLAYTSPTADERGWLKPLLQAERAVGIPRGGEIPSRPGYWCHILTLDGGALFTIKRGGLLLSCAGVACTAQAAAEVWPRLEEAHLASYKAVIENYGFDTPDHFLTIPDKPTELPWVALSHQPGIGQDMDAAPWVNNFVIELGQELMLEAMGQGRL
jgi:hypothetical protein